MNFTTFFALLARDAHVARRNFILLSVQTLLQPMMFVFVFGRVMTASGFLNAQYKSLLLPGIAGMSMMMTGAWAVAMPLVSEFQFTKEIEDRLLAPIDLEWLAVEKVLAGMIQALVSGLVVIPAGWLVMGGVSLSNDHIGFAILVALLVAGLSSTFGLLLGCSMGPQHIGLMFSVIFAPMIFFGCTYYPWAALAKFPVLKRLVLVNPLVYASEGFRGALVPEFPHLPRLAVIGALIGFDILFLALGLRRFRQKAVA